MTKQEALETLDLMQSQIIGGSSIFGDIADVIRRQENVDSTVAEAMHARMVERVKCSNDGAKASGA